MRKWLKRVSLAALVGALIAAGWCVRYPYHHLPLKSSPMEFSINAGSTLRSATQQMVDAGILASPLPFEVLTRLFGDPKNIKAGNYEIEAGITPLRLMRTGYTERSSVTSTVMDLPSALKRGAETPRSRSAASIWSMAASASRPMPR